MRNRVGSLRLNQTQPTPQPPATTLKVFACCQKLCSSLWLFKSLKCSEYKIYFPKDLPSNLSVDYSYSCRIDIHFFHLLFSFREKTHKVHFLDCCP